MARFNTTPHGTRYWEQGDQTCGQTLVLLHGVGTSSDYWLQVSPWLPRDIHVLAPDLPGSGLTPAPNGAPSFRQLAQSLRMELSRLVPQGNVVTLAGHSLGALVAAEAARQDPRFASKLILVDPVLFRAEAVLINPALMIKNPKYSLVVLSQLAGVMVPGSFSSRILKSKSLRDLILRDQLGGGPDVSALVLRQCLAHTTGWPTFRAVQVIRAARDVKVRALFGALQLPLATVRGTRDPLTNDEEFATLARLCRVTGSCDISGAGHSPMLNHPQELARSLQSFAARVSI